MAQGQTLAHKSKLKRIRKFGFRARMETVGGRKVLSSRRSKKRWNLSVSEEFGTGKEKALKFKRLR